MNSHPPYVDLPALDRVRSPMTGWSRDHWERLADHLLDSAARYATPDFAQIRIPGRISGSGVVSDGLEGFARTFLLAAFRIAGAPAGTQDHVAERYARGLAAGTARDNSKKRTRWPGQDRRPAPAGTRWPDITDYSQQMVEAAAIAIALHETRDVIWDKLDGRVQDDVRHWLGGFVGKRPHPNNWMLFQVVTEQFLKSVGGPYDDAEIGRGLDLIEDWYVGDGWYTDGAGQNFDYYIGWAMHLYPLMWARIAGPDGDQGRARVYRSRLKEFLGQYQYFFGADGAPVHQGRSLTYRYATVAPLWLGELAGGADAGATPLTPGQARRLASGTVRYFTERGVPGADGLLRLGWLDPFLPVTQRYSGPGSPYWASKGFLGLLLPADHPAWTEREQPGPNDEADQVMAMPAPGFLLHSTRHDGIVRLLNHGSDHQGPGHQPPPRPDNSNKRDDPHYAKFAYSNQTAPGAAETSWRANVDSHIAVLPPADTNGATADANADTDTNTGTDADAAGKDGGATRRVVIERLAVAGHQASSRYRAALPDGEECAVETAVVIRGNWEVRAHRVTAPAGTSVREGGYAVADGTAPRTRVSGPVPWAFASRPDGLTSLVVGLHGWARAHVREEAEANAFGPRSAVPYLTSAPRTAAETLHVTLVVLTGDGIDPAALSSAITAEVRGPSVLVAFPGETVELRLGAS